MATAEAEEMQDDSESLVLRYLDNPQEELKGLVMNQYSGLVERIARRFAGLDPFEDLVQVGYMGLLNALTKFDRTAGVRFTTYATYLVSGEIKHYLRDRGQTIRHPAWLQELRHKVNKTAGMLQQTHGRTATEREIAEQLGVGESSIREVLQTQEMLRVASLDAAIPGDEDGESDLDKLEAGGNCIEQLSLEDRMVLEQAMKQLRDLEREVLVLFHFKSMNQTEIANTLNISCNYVSHILRQSLAKLRKILVAENERDRVLRRQTHEVDYDLVDAVTGAYTEGFFKTRLEEELHRASSAEGAVAIVLVRFRGLEALSSFYGESSVSSFLSDASDFFKDNLRRLDLVCRYGEHGFGMILPSTGHTVTAARDRLVKKIGSWVSERAHRNSPIWVEMGHSAFPCDGRSSKDLIKAAELKPVVVESRLAA